MKILLEGLDGTLVNFDNVFDIYPVELTDGWRVKARCASFYKDCYETVTLFKGTKEKADEFMEKFKDAIINAQNGINIINVKV